MTWVANTQLKNRHLFRWVKVSRRDCRVELAVRSQVCILQALGVGEAFRKFQEKALGGYNCDGGSHQSHSLR